MWTSYSARHAAQLIGLPESAVRSCIRDGLVGAPGTVPAQLTFRDLTALRMIKALLEDGLSLIRVRRDLVELQHRLTGGTTFAELTLEARGGHVQVRGDRRHAERGQLSFALDPDASAELSPAELRELPRGYDTPAPIAVAPTTAEQWLTRALQLEDRDPVAAIDAYRRSLRLRPSCTEAWINLGRMFAESGDREAARECFRSALALDGGDATAHYNLGVIAQDAGNEEDAIVCYRRALEIDPRLAEAHYNLATLFDQSGDSRAAIRHINEYRKLTR
ncbi:MAG TPA: tetratricopeptide repeat protein [Kofleriaceae bacterium]